MPTYQYACTACGEQLEAVQSFTDAALTECPACGGALRKVFSSIGVVFKGSGFYKTDSRAATADKGGEPAKTEPSAAPAATSDSASKAEASSKAAKPAAATTSTPAAKSA